MEVRPDRVPQPVPAGTTLELLAVRLILDRFAAAYIARTELNYHGELTGLRKLSHKKFIRQQRTKLRNAQSHRVSISTNARLVARTVKATEQERLERVVWGSRIVL